MSEYNWWTIMSKHWGKVLCGLLGLIFAILVITLNFWWALFIYICVAAGIAIGWRIDVSKSLRQWLSRFLSPGEE